MDHYERQWLQQMIQQSQAETLERYQANARGFTESVESAAIIIPKGQTYTMPPGQYSAQTSVASINLAPTLNTDFKILANTSWFIESKLQVTNQGLADVQLLYRKTTVRTGGVGLQFTWFSAAPSTLPINWNFVGPWSIVDQDALGAITVYNFNGPNALAYNYVANHVVTTSGVARF